MSAATETCAQRVMPSLLFILSRFFLRVDRVLFRVFDVRLYHAFGSKEVLREIRGREATYDNVKRVRRR
jgi:type 2A phosphatase activator TIP41